MHGFSPERPEQPGIYEARSASAPEGAFEYVRYDPDSDVAVLIRASGEFTIELDAVVEWGARMPTAEDVLEFLGR